MLLTETCLSMGVPCYNYLQIHTFFQIKTTEDRQEHILANIED